jgi:hypothetical protein
MILVGGFAQKGQGDIARQSFKRRVRRCRKRKYVEFVQPLIQTRQFKEFLENTQIAHARRKIKLETQAGCKTPRMTCVTPLDAWMSGCTIMLELTVIAGGLSVWIKMFSELNVKIFSSLTNESVKRSPVEP